MKSGSTEITIYLIRKIKKYAELDYRLAFRELYIYYQNSKYWKEVIKAVRERDNNRCVDCVLVCLKCHNKRHRDDSVKTPFWATRNGELSRQEEEEMFKSLKEVEI